MSRPDPSDLDRLIQRDLADREAAHQLRRRRTVTPVSSTHVLVDGRRLVNFASNNYLGLTHHPRLIAAAQRCIQSEGVGSGAAALITGHTTRHATAERALATWKSTEDAVILPSGYQANHAAVQTLAALGSKGAIQSPSDTCQAPGFIPGSVRGETRARGTRFLVDKLAHASLLDAVRATGADFRVFPHNNLAKLRRLLADAPPDRLQVVLTESIFSMDGDAADLRGLVDLKRKYPFVLLLDEAHGSGVYGPRGAGLAAELGLAEHVDVTIVTLSKALGGAGGAVCGSAAFCAALVNHGRAFIYSTSVAPVTAAVAEEAIHVIADEPHRQSRVRDLATRVRCALSSRGVTIPAGDSPIIPVILGQADHALAASRRLADAGILVPAVRPPTVPRGASRLRVTLSADHTDDEVHHLMDNLFKLSVEMAEPR